MARFGRTPADAASMASCSMAASKLSVDGGLRGVNAMGRLEKVSVGLRDSVSRTARGSSEFSSMSSASAAQ